MALCFADVDILLKLSTLDLLTSALDALDAAPAEVRVTPTLWDRLRVGRTSLVRKYGEEAVERVWSVVQQGGRIEKDYGAAFDSLVGCPGIDSGEALLFLAGQEMAGSLVATGDKTSLRALATERDAADVCHALAGRVVCLESVLRLLFDRLGAEEVAGRIRASGDLDKNLRFLCGYSISYAPEDVVVNFDREIESLRAVTGPLLFAFPEKKA